MGTRKIMIITAVALLAVGGITCGVTYAALGHDLRGVSSADCVTNTHFVEDSFDNIEINVDTADIIFEKAEDGKCRVECYEYDDEIHDVIVDSNKLKINVKSKKKIRFGFYTEDPKVTLYLTEDAFKNINIETDTGDTKFGDISADDIKIETDTGDIRLSNVTVTGDFSVQSDTGDVDLKGLSSEKAVIDTDTGDVRLADVTVTGEFKIDTDTGDVAFDKCDAGSIHVESDTGDVKGTLLSDKVFTTTTDTGDVKVPNTSTGGSCEIKTSTGDINISIP